jgi:hypothetical protein
MIAADQEDAMKICAPEKSTEPQQSSRSGARRISARMQMQIRQDVDRCRMGTAQRPYAIMRLRADNVEQETFVSVVRANIAQYLQQLSTQKPLLSLVNLHSAVRQIFDASCGIPLTHVID